MKVWDLEIENNYKKNKLQNNLDLLYKKYGSNFYIKYKDIKLFVHLYYQCIDLNYNIYIINILLFRKI